MRWCKRSSPFPKGGCVGERKSWLAGSGRPGKEALGTWGCFSGGRGISACRERAAYKAAVIDKRAFEKLADSAEPAE